MRLSVCFSVPLCSGPLWPSPRPRAPSHFISSFLVLLFDSPAFRLTLVVPSLDYMASYNAARSSTPEPGDCGCPTTPRHHTQSSAQPWAASPVLKASDKEYVDMAKEMEDVTIGPIPFDEFLDAYLPSPKKVPGQTWFRTKSAELGKLGSRDGEDEIARSIS